MRITTRIPRDRSSPISAVARWAPGRGRTTPLRYSNTDLNFDEGLPGTEAPLGSVRGGEQEIFAAGINWYLNSNLKLMLNYLHIDVDRLNPAGLENAAPFGPPPATPPIGVNVGQTLDVYALRSQFSF
jgi:phosphate-selective porin OprO/OprP